MNLKEQGEVRRTVWREGRKGNRLSQIAQKQRSYLKVGMFHCNRDLCPMLRYLFSVFYLFLWKQNQGKRYTFFQLFPFTIVFPKKKKFKNKFEEKSKHENVFWRLTICLGNNQQGTLADLPGWGACHLCARIFTVWSLLERGKLCMQELFLKDSWKSKGPRGNGKHSKRNHGKQKGKNLMRSSWKYNLR